jgi:hypothetical protein
MAALDADEIAQTYEIYGLPQGGAGFTVPMLSTLFGPSGESYDFSSIITALNTKITATTEYQRTRLRVLLARWVVIGATSPLQVSEGASGKGVLADHEAERQSIHRGVCNILGFYLPYGGFVRDIQRNTNGICNGGFLSR